MTAKKHIRKANQVEVSNLEKVFYPKAKFTKGDVINYYAKISKYLLPYLKGRPITLKRFPDGVNGIFFYEKQCPSYAPKWIKTAKIARADGTKIDYCIINDLRSLIWVVNTANLEFHSFLHQLPNLGRPTSIVFDLDPGEGADILLCCDVALKLKKLFESLKLKSFPKTSGSKGLQIYIPLNSSIPYEKTKNFAHTIALGMEQQYPDLVVSKMKRNLRAGKVLLDWSQNDEHKTTVCVYSLRAKERPTVSTPLKWTEVSSALKNGNVKTLFFEADKLIKRLNKIGDIFEPVLTLKQRLPNIDIL